MTRRIPLAVLPSTAFDHRVVLVHCRDERGARFELQQQSLGEGVGWFVQSTVTLEPAQAAALRQSLGTAPPAPERKRHPRSASPRNHTPSEFPALRVWTAESA